ncbi:MAG: cysteine desulfurase NifS, partial [Lachnospiraceae bacterium]|nr:cysteine desulfurase NifS [Lachnospiraceae bacterium]
MSDAAIKTLTDLLKDTYGNPSSLYEFGQKAKEVLEQARRDVA